MSLLLRIFLSFWLASLLLALSLFLIQRYYGGEVVEQTQAVLGAQAETAALIWREGGIQAVRHWLRRQPDRHRLVLVNDKGESLLRRPLPRHLQQWLPKAVMPGVERIRERHLMLSVELPDVMPKLFLVTEIDPGRLHIFRNDRRIS